MFRRTFSWMSAAEARRAILPVARGRLERRDARSDLRARGALWLCRHVTHLREELEARQATAERAAPAPVPVPDSAPSAALLRSPAQARRLAATLGNAAFGTLVARAPRTAADTASAAAMAPDGPLAQLRDELDDTFVDEDKCLQLLGQLGEGERTLVGRDSTMLQQMADAFNIGEMSRAIEHVTLTVKWQMHWLSRAGSLGDVDQAVLTRLLNRADAPAIAELIGWPEVRDATRAAWRGNPLDLPAATDPVAVRGWLATAGGMTWIRERAGAPALVQWIAANDPAATLTAIKAGGQLTALLDAIPGNPEIRPQLKQLFVASTDAADRRRLYEIRFNTRAPGPIDWVAGGEALWTQQETAADTGGTRAAVEAAVAAGGPQDVNAAITADSKSPLVELRDELDDTFVDEDRCLVLISQLSDREAYLVTKDAAMMRNIAGAFNGTEMSRVLERLGHLMALKDALAWIEQANESGDVDASVTHRLVGAASAQDIAEVIGYPAAFTALKSSIGVRATTLTPLLADAGKRDFVVTTYPDFLEWVLANPGDVSAILRSVSTVSPGGFFTALRTSGKADRFISALPLGSQMPAPDRVALRLLFLSGADVPMKISMLNRRYNLARTGEDTTHAGAGTFEAATLDRIWDVLDRIPEQDLADNDWLTELTRRTNPSAPTPQGVTGGNRVAVGYDPAHLGDAESGEFADPGDQMSGTNLFDTNLLHEMAHASDGQYKWTRDGGPFDTDADLGAWADHRLNYGAIVDRLATDTNLATTFPIAAELSDVKTALTDVMTNKSTNAETGFQNQAGAAYGVGADKWKPLWTRVSGHAIVPAVQDGQASKSPWNNPPGAVAGRIYQDTDYNYWASYASATRAGGKLSRYQFRDKRDFFAETYATYYETAPADPGRLVRAWNNKVYEWFRENVDRGRETRATP